MKIARLLTLSISLMTSEISFGETPLELPAQWQYSAPFIAPEARDDEPSYAQKDPTVVFHDGRWHVFMTVKLPTRSAIEYCSFERWEDAAAAPRTILELTEKDYFCAPQIFYFEPQQQWYLVYQLAPSSGGGKKMAVAYSTTTDLADPASWRHAREMLDGGPDDPRTVGGLDYWIICDDERAYLFFTSLNGKLWRLWTKKADFPQGFDHCELALEADIFEAAHIYRVAGQQRYFLFVEKEGQRFFKAYEAYSLDGVWSPLADTADRPFAGWKNIQPASGVERWTDNVSHGELVRATNDETLTFDPSSWQLVFQGVLESEKPTSYGKIPWRIGMLEPVE